VVLFRASLNPISEQAAEQDFLGSMERTTPTVLVIDDVAEIVEELLTLLSLREISATGAHSLDGAIGALENAPQIRVIACDVRLGKESGFDICDRIRTHPRLKARNFAYIFISGDPMRLNQASHLPKHSILTKPVEPRALIELLREKLDAMRTIG